MDTGPKTGEVETAEPLPSLYGNRGLGWVLLIGGGIGLLASFMLTIEYIHSLTEPDAQLLCDVNVFVTCQPAMNSSAGAILGFPNVILGLVSFTIAVVSGVVLLAGSALPRWYWIGLQVGLTFAIVFVHWLMVQSIFRIEALCLYCMAVWLVTAILFWYVTLYNLHMGRTRLPRWMQAGSAVMIRNHTAFLSLWVLLVAVVMLQAFWL